MNQPQTYLSDRQLAIRFGVSRCTPWRWAERGQFPAPVQLTPGCTRWRLSDVEAWEANKSATPQASRDHKRTIRNNRGNGERQK